LRVSNPTVLIISQALSSLGRLTHAAPGNVEEEI